MPASALDNAAGSQPALALSEGRRLVHVATLSGLGLFAELLLIRWLDAQVPALAFVRNLPLIGSFLGLGIGYALSGHRRQFLPMAVPLLAAAFGLGVVTSGWTFAGPALAESNVPIASATSLSELLSFCALITATFALTVLATVPLGQAAGALMAGLPALRAYAANLTGALAGVLLAFALSALNLPPAVGLTAIMGLLLLYVREGRARVAGALLGGACVVSMALLDATTGTVWSPYNKITIARIPPIHTETGTVEIGRLLRVQNIYYQRILDLRAAPSAEALRAYPSFLAQAYFAYNLPYAVKSPRRVLIVGAGTGNDVAAALRHGVLAVDAVEIDPVIQRIGAALHPERPYSDPRVHVIVDDARAYLRRPGPSYDMIVFALLDSHSSHYSSFANIIRLDNYVYTVEALREALARLTPDGLLYLSVYIDRPWVGSRLGMMLQRAWGASPLTVPSAYDDGYVYLAGPGLGRHLDKTAGFVPFSKSPLASTAAGPPATDDWPFLYLREPRVSSVVLASAFSILIVGFLLVRVSFRKAVSFDRHLFFLGAGFLLVETRSIAQLALLFGTTWRVSAIAIAAILALAVLATLVILRTGPLPRIPLYLALLAGLGANYLVAPGLGLGGGVQALAMASFLVLPLFFAGLIFGSAVHDRHDLAPALASNLLGSVLGGLLENASMVWGIGSLSLLAAALYALSFRR